MINRESEIMKKWPMPAINILLYWYLLNTDAKGIR